MSGKPAARVTDSTAHGGQICTGEPTVLIGNKPAARVTDEHNCRPGHGSGPILPPCATTVLINNKPAARVGDKHSCRCGHQDPIVTGDPTVLIGDTGGSGAGLAALALLGEVLGRAVKPTDPDAEQERRKGEGEGEGSKGTTSPGTSGAKYGSADDAAKSALGSANPTSISKNCEYGGLIYKDDASGKYGYTTPTAGTGTGFNPYAISVPDGTTLVGDYHTHGDYSTADAAGNPVRTSDPSKDAFNSDNFSTADLMGIGHDATSRPGYKGYLGTPSGKFKKFDPATGNISNF